MDTEQLKTFLEVSKTRHFGRAAQQLFLSQSAVSSRIKSLEEQLGTPLFVRNRNDIQLTPAGNRLLSHAENILSAWGRAKHDVSIEEEMSASLAIAATPSLWDITLQEWLHALHQSQPDIAIHGEVLDTEVIVRRIMEGTLDLGFTFEPPQLPQIEVTQIASIPLVMVSTQANLTTHEALTQDYVLVDWGLAFAIAHARYFPELQSPAIHLPLGRIALDYLFSCGGSAYLVEPEIFIPGDHQYCRSCFANRCNSVDLMF
ncbi:MAG: LysR family transcriptional regulator, partial [Candidatus Thiodiazotropha sp. 6PDIVS]